MKKKNITPILGQVLKKIAPLIGATVIIEPRWQVVGQITFKSGKRRYFRGSCIDLNSLGASEIAKDKDYANMFMNQMGYPIVPGSMTFFKKSFGKRVGMSHRDIDGAYRYAKKLGFPVIVKPNSGSQGTNVSLVHNKLELYSAIKSVFEKDRIALVQQPVRGKDYRVVVLDNRVISAYERVPLNVTGDGRSSIEKLLKAKQKQFVIDHRDTCINFSDPRMIEKLKHQKLTLKSVIEKDRLVYLLDNANLSTGGDSIDATDKIHEDFQKISINLTRDMGLRLCGVDLMIDGDISEKPSNYWILEINSAPGLDHYAKSGVAQEKIVEELYLEVLKSMEK